ncbi:hypothetical protein O6257_13175 [Salmonella enterica subsp. enterica]|uniref:hypothetical protein n=1 Tax=Salmonella TaxID=590 RepID=UPI0020A0C0B7|nr:hypothetical protein [Salmonella enterica]MCP1351568.1 hypothetical protein [Salmonella sp. S87]MCZ7156258.1 hypothetical protein [Salmonella enterica]MCZ7164486.1 hypothetical protein [Salmonella enterica]MCZ7169076.1 hypothetical protein [Salmonella enterica]MCZ7187657.1 hypothetical protein [Salmonella enterica]
MKNIITILMVAVISFFTGNVSANTVVPLPHNLTDVTDGTEFWCQGTDTTDGRCKYLGTSKDMQYGLVHAMGGTACWDGFYGVINFYTGKAQTIKYNDNQSCEGDIKASFVTLKNGKLGVKLYDNPIHEVVGLDQIKI